MTRRRLVNATVSPRSTRSITCFRFCWSSLIEMVTGFMYYIM